MLVALTNLWYLFRKTLEVGVLITPILMAVRVLVVELQKNNARPSLNGSDVGMKMQLHSLAIGMAVLSRSIVLSTQSQFTALSHLKTWFLVGWG